jgi:glycosyltransferase involved in cell wall biosynthesis
LPLPLETDILKPCKSEEKEDYIFYTGRLSFEKNPHGFIDIINRTGLKGKMIVYDTVEDIMGTKEQYSDILNCNNKNIEIILNPTKEKMIELVKHAKFTVLPYFFAEPFGVAAANSVLCGTPLIAFPYGNVRNMTHLLPKTLDEMINVLEMNDEQYLNNLKITMKRSNELRQLHDPKNAIKIWDEAYENLMVK